MGKCLIFCAAGFDGMLRDPQPSDLIIAADGGITINGDLSKIKRD